MNSPAPLSEVRISELADQAYGGFVDEWTGDTHDEIADALRELLAARATITALHERAGEWVKWDRDSDELPPNGTYITTVSGRGYRGAFISVTGIGDFYKDDVLAYIPRDLPPPYDPHQPKEGG